jgi:hypothetical protein
VASGVRAKIWGMDHVRTVLGDRGACVLLLVVLALAVAGLTNGPLGWVMLGVPLTASVVSRGSSRKPPPPFTTLSQPATRTSPARSRKQQPRASADAAGRTSRRGRRRIAN